MRLIITDGRDDIVILVNPHPSKEWIVKRAHQRLVEELERLQVSLNTEKTKTAYLDKSFSYLGFDLRKAEGRNGKKFVLLTPKKQALINIRQRIRDTIKNNLHKNTKEIIHKVNLMLIGWVNYYRVGHSSKAFSLVRDYVEQRIRRLLAKRTRKRGCGFGWKRWSSNFIYGVQGLYWDYSYLQSLGTSR